MGKWNRRFARRSFYQDKPPPPHCLYYTGSCYRGDWRNPRLPWEERFCLSMGIPFQKVVVAKKYMHCHDNVVNWNDLACEEAFHNAKRRFWASVNGLPCDDPPPDPDMYNAELDWNPEIDPELISDVERAYFNPDEAQKSEITDHLSSGATSGWDEKNNCKVDNPWESINPRILENVNNSWGHPPQGDQALKDGLWGGGVNKSWGDGGWGGSVNKSWGWNHGISSMGQTTPDNNYYSDSWGHGGQIAGSFKGWGEAKNNAGGPTRWGTSGNGSWSSGKLGENGWKNEGPVEKRWRDNSWGWKNWESQNNGDGRGVKREGPPENNPARYKSSRFKREDLGVNQQWGHQRNQKKVSFV